MLVLTIFVSVSSATNINEESIGINSNEMDRITPCVMVGIMHVKFELDGWGFRESWTPICILRIGLFGRHFLGPLSGSINPDNYNITGIKGLRYYICQYTDGGCFFICARLT